MPQDPDPPHAEGRKIFFWDRADKRGGFPEIFKESSLLPLMVISNSPLLVTFDSTKRRTVTRIRITPVKTNMLKMNNTF